MNKTLENLCRLCSETNGDLIWVYDTRVHDDIKNIISVTTGVEILETDKITQKICKACCQTAIQAFKFRNNALRNDRTLKEKYDKMQITVPKIKILRNFVISKPAPKSKKIREQMSGRNLAHPSITTILNNYPTINLPANINLKTHYGPYVTLLTDEVDKWFESHNAKKGKECRIAVKDYKDADQNSKESMNKHERRKRAVNYEEIGSFSSSDEDDFTTTKKKRKLVPKIDSSSSENSIEERMRLQQGNGLKKLPITETNLSTNGGISQNSDDSGQNESSIVMANTESLSLKPNTKTLNTLNQTEDDVQKSMAKENSLLHNRLENNVEVYHNKLFNSICGPKKQKENINISNESFQMPTISHVTTVTNETFKESYNPAAQDSPVKADDVKHPETSLLTDSAVLPHLTKSVKLLTCKICDAVFYTLKTLVNHEKRTHTKCPFCRIKFRSLEEKSQHWNKCKKRDVQPVVLKNAVLVLTKVDQVPEIKQKYQGTFDQQLLSKDTDIEDLLPVYNDNDDDDDSNGTFSSNGTKESDNINAESGTVTLHLETQGVADVSVSCTNSSLVSTETPFSPQRTQLVPTNEPVSSSFEKQGTVNVLDQSNIKNEHFSNSALTTQKSLPATHGTTSVAAQTSNNITNMQYSNSLPTTASALVANSQARTKSVQDGEGIQMNSTGKSNVICISDDEDASSSNEVTATTISMSTPTTTTTTTTVRLNEQTSTAASFFRDSPKVFLFEDTFLKDIDIHESDVDIVKKILKQTAQHHKFPTVKSNPILEGSAPKTIVLKNLYKELHLYKIPIQISYDEHIFVKYSMKKPPPPVKKQDYFKDLVPVDLVRHVAAQKPKGGAPGESPKTNDLGSSKLVQALTGVEKDVVLDKTKDFEQSIPKNKVMSTTQNQTKSSIKPVKSNSEAQTSVPIVLNHSISSPMTNSLQPPNYIIATPTGNQVTQKRSTYVPASLVSSSSTASGSRLVFVSAQMTNDNNNIKLNILPTNSLITTTTSSSSQGVVHTVSTITSATSSNLNSVLLPSTSFIPLTTQPTTNSLNSDSSSTMTGNKPSIRVKNLSELF